MNVRRFRSNGLKILPMLSLVWVWACGPLDAVEGEFAEVPSGTSLEIQLDETLSTRSTRIGSPLSGSVARPVVYDEVVVIPEGARVGGVVTSISREPPLVSGEFVTLRVGDAVYAIRGVVTEAGMVPRSGMKDEAAKIGGGAAAGAVLGGAIGGDVKSAAIGAAAGAAAGTGVAMATKERWAILPAGSRLALRLEEPLRLAVARAESGTDNVDPLVQ
ncbi:MAG: hypothetical protein P8Y10_08555 [Gemmatimonadales bacterium]|jgi:hypothetical protein